MKVSFVGDWLPRTVARDVPQGIVVGNLECAFSDDTVVSGKAYTSILPMNCIRNVAGSGFAALSLANNHVNDAGNFDSFYSELKRQCPNIQFFGTADNPYAKFETDEGLVYVIGCLEPCRSRGTGIFRQEDVEALVRELKGEDKRSLVFVYPHWGMEGEYTRYPSPEQQRLAKQWIEAGADGVFGSHSHVPQGRETYKGKPIYYSLGNFDFDHPENKLYQGTSERLIISIESNGTVLEDFDSKQTQSMVEEASRELADWNNWRWAMHVGSTNIRKNMASWRIRLRNDFRHTIIKFIVWQFLPKIILFRVANAYRKLTGK